MNITRAIKLIGSARSMLKEAHGDSFERARDRKRNEEIRRRAKAEKEYIDGLNSARESARNSVSQAVMNSSTPVPAAVPAADAVTQSGNATAPNTEAQATASGAVTAPAIQESVSQQVHDPSLIRGIPLELARPVVKFLPDGMTKSDLRGNIALSIVANVDKLLDAPRAKSYKKLADMYMNSQESILPGTPTVDLKIVNYGEKDENGNPVKPRYEIVGEQYPWAERNSRNQAVTAPTADIARRETESGMAETSAVPAAEQTVFIPDKTLAEASEARTAGAPAGSSGTSPGEGSGNTNALRNMYLVAGGLSAAAAAALAISLGVSAYRRKKRKSIPRRLAGSPVLKYAQDTGYRVDYSAPVKYDEDSPTSSAAGRMNGHGDLYNTLKGALVRGAVRGAVTSTDIPVAISENVFNDVIKPVMGPGVAAVASAQTPEDIRRVNTHSLPVLSSRISDIATAIPLTAMDYDNFQQSYLPEKFRVKITPPEKLPDLNRLITSMSDDNPGPGKETLDWRQPWFDALPYMFSTPKGALFNYRQPYHDLAARTLGSQLSQEDFHSILDDPKYSKMPGFIGGVQTGIVDGLDVSNLFRYGIPYWPDRKDEFEKSVDDYSKHLRGYDDMSRRDAWDASPDGRPYSTSGVSRKERELPLEAIRRELVQYPSTSQLFTTLMDGGVGGPGMSVFPALYDYDKGALTAPGTNMVMHAINRAVPDIPGYEKEMNSGRRDMFDRIAQLAEYLGGRRGDGRQGLYMPYGSYAGAIVPDQAMDDILTGLEGHESDLRKTISKSESFNDNAAANDVFSQLMNTIRAYSASRPRGEVMQ